MTSSRKSAPLPRLHLVTNDVLLRSTWFGKVSEALVRAGGGRVALHLRGRELSGGEMWGLGEHAREVTAEFGAWLFVNDRLDVAIAAGADGVQLGRDSFSVSDARRLAGEGVVVGASVHTAAEAAEAAGGGADFLMAGTLFESSSHPGRSGTGPGWLEGLKQLSIPVIGIGGISVGRVEEVVRAGAYGVAVISGVWNAADPVREMERYLRMLEV